MAFVDVLIYGDGETKVTADAGPGTGKLRTEGEFCPDTIRAFYNATVAQGAQIAYDALNRVPGPRSDGQFVVATIDDDGCTIGTGSRTLMTLPVGFEDLDRLEDLLFGAFPSREPVTASKAA